MNNRIKELAAQADEYATEKARDGFSNYNLVYDQKFAELIVLECTKVLDEDSYLIPELGGYAHDIRKMFGVKE